jgi:hypothetical protein
MRLLLALWLAAPQASSPPPQAGPAGAKSGNERKAALLRDLGAKLEASNAPSFGRGRLDELRKLVESLPKNAPPQQRAHFLSLLGDTELSFGNVDEAIRIYQQCIEIASAARDTRVFVVQQVKLAMAWLRHAERDNCCARHTADSCIIPIQGEGIHSNRRGSEKAIEQLTIALNLDGTNLQAMWLLNVAHMTLGTWPDKVAPVWRIPESALRSERGATWRGRSASTRPRSRAAR